MKRAIPTTLFISLFLSAAGHDSHASTVAPVVETFTEDTDRAHVKVKLSIRTSIDGDKWTWKKAVYPLKGQDVALKVPEIDGADIRWYLVFPDLTQNYNNANPPWEENAYAWVGFDNIAYHRMELTEHYGSWKIHPFATEVDFFDKVSEWFTGQGYEGRALRFYNEGLGTFWFQVEVEKDGKVTRSRGLDDVGAKGISRKVTRVSIRGEEGYLGYVTSFFNIPGIFGSVPYQSRNYIGADCADVLMAAWSRWKERPLKKNFNVQAMVTKFRKLAEFEMSKGEPDAPVTWGEQVNEGDFIAVRYGKGGKKYHHVGALYKDVDGDGLLGAADLVIHAGPDPLHLSKLKWGAFDGHVVILRHSR